MKIPEIGWLLEAREGENIEFKEAKNAFEFDELAKYACALANCGGGYVALGITDERPRQVVGTRAFDQPERTRNGLMDRLRLRIVFHLLRSDGKRVLVFEVPPRPVGVPIQDKGIAWWRKGDSLVEMPMEEMRAIFAEAGHDFSADICREADLTDLDEDAIEAFQRRWAEKSKSPAIAGRSQEQLLRDCEAVTAKGVTRAGCGFPLPLMRIASRSARRSHHDAMQSNLLRRIPLIARHLPIASICVFMQSDAIETQSE